MAGADLIERCYANGWTDGLPVVPPTESRVAAMLGGRDPEAVVCEIGPVGTPATHRLLAANAVMAGCLPAYYPVLVAAVRAAARVAVGVTIHSVAPMLLVNGPARRQLGFNSEANTLGAGTRANATVGRALHLVLQNVAGMRPGGMDASTLGHPGKYTYCFAEHEEASPWPPFHTTRGLDAAASAVTVFLADAPLCISHQHSEDPAVLLDTLADALPLIGTYTMFFGGDLFVVLSPEHAFLLSDMTRSDVQRALYERARRPLAELLGRGMFGYQAEGMGRPSLRSEPLDPQRLVAPVDDPADIQLVVAGRRIGGYSAVIFGSGRSQTLAIEELPA